MATDSAARRVTIADIAAATGVSVATVSKVLNDRTDVAGPTRALVKAALAEQQYVRTNRTKNGANASGGLIDMLFNDPSSPWAAEMIRGAEAACRESGVGVVVSVFNGASGHSQRWIEAVAQRGSRGAILALSQLSTADHRHIAKLGLPMVLVDPVGDIESDLPSIGSSNWGGGLAATKHLLDLGHRRIGTIAGPMRYLCSQARVAGYRAALERADIPVDPDLIQQGDFHYDSAVRGALALLDLAEPPTAIFAANDEQALGVYAAAQQRGLRVPADLSVVGFDDVPMSQWALPPLTTVRQPIADLAALATRTLLGGNSALPQGRTELPTTLVVRDSTTPAHRATRRRT